MPVFHLIVLDSDSYSSQQTFLESRDIQYFVADIHQRMKSEISLTD